MTTEVRVRVHANYVQTSIHFQLGAYAYETYASGDREFLEAVWQHQNAETLREWAKNYVQKKESREVPDFNGYLYVEFVFPKMGDLNVVEPTNIRYVTLKGIKVLTKVFSGQFRLPLLQRLTETIGTYDAAKIEALLKTLAAGV